MARKKKDKRIGRKQSTLDTWGCEVMQVGEKFLNYALSETFDPEDFETTGGSPGQAGMHSRDAADAYDIAEMLFEGNLEGALEATRRLDTAPREEFNFYYNFRW